MRWWGLGSRTLLGRTVLPLHPSHFGVDQQIRLNLSKSYPYLIRVRNHVKELKTPESMGTHSSPICRRLRAADYAYRFLISKISQLPK